MDAIALELSKKNTISAMSADGAVRRDQTSDLQLLIDSTPGLIHTGTPDGYLDFFNRTWLMYIGRPLEDLQGWNWTAFIHLEGCRRNGGKVARVSGQRRTLPG